MGVGLIAAGESNDLKRLAKSARNGEAVEGAVLEGMALIDMATLTDLLLKDKSGVDLILSAERVSGGAAFVLPDAVRNALADQPDEALTALSKKWARKGEFRGLMEPSTLHAFLAAARATATDARNAGRSLVFVNV